MPGLDQLKIFSERIENIGKELDIRTARGENIDAYKVPPAIGGDDDSADFAGGLPTAEIDMGKVLPDPLSYTEEGGDTESAIAASVASAPAAPAPSDPVPPISATPTPVDSAPAISGSGAAPEDDELPEFTFTPPGKSPKKANGETAFDFGNLEDEDSADPAENSVNLEDLGIPEEEPEDYPAPVRNEAAVPEMAEDAEREMPPEDEALPEEETPVALEDEPPKTEGLDSELPSLGGEPEGLDSELPSLDEETELLSLDGEAEPSEAELPGLGGEPDLLDAAGEKPELSGTRGEGMAEASGEASETREKSETPAESPPEVSADVQFAGLESFKIPDVNVEGEDASPDAIAAGLLKQPIVTEFSSQDHKKFMRNIDTYPLNLMIQVEEIIGQNEFDASIVVELINAVINHVSAKSLAVTLEKLTGISISVPSDFESRSAGNIQSYRKTWSYRLRNRIIPGVLLLMVAFVVGSGIFFAVKDNVYTPLMADYLYKQGYKLLENALYQESEAKFDEALRYQSQKKWFFAYARGYRERKQYGRAEMMYRNIGARYDHDKQAGLEYAEMVAYELHEYERAEDLVKRQVLDWHINDKDGLLLLGDIALEAGTELIEASKDNPAAESASEAGAIKLQEARVTYTDLMSLYGALDIYLARMMRYFIRIDNLQEVLPLKNYFMSKPPDKNPLEGRDLVDLSGYLLEKEFGPLVPHEEGLREHIEGVRDILEAAVKKAPNSAEAHYHFGKYFVYGENSAAATTILEEAQRLFEGMPSKTTKQVREQINTYRLLGEAYYKEKETLRAEQSFIDGLALFDREHRLNDLQSTSDVGTMYSDIADLYYFIDYDLDSALENYRQAVENHHDTPSVRYRIGYINYGKGNYSNALGSFIKTVNEKRDDYNALLALANTLALQDNNFAAEGYYTELVERINLERDRVGAGLVVPQYREEHRQLVERYKNATNNLGVVLYRQSLRTNGNRKAAEAMQYLSESNRAWDALTRNLTTMNRSDGGNLAETNMRYIIAPGLGFSPEIYTEIPRTLMNEAIRD